MNDWTEEFEPNEPTDLAEGNGTMVLVLGVISIVCGVIGPCFCYASGIAVLTGIGAWTMGNKDLAGIEAGEVDPAGRGGASTGKICGIIGVFLGAGFLSFSILSLALLLLVDRGMVPPQ